MAAAPDARPVTPPRRPRLARRVLRGLAAAFLPTVVGANVAGVVASSRGLPRHGGLLGAVVFVVVFAAVAFVFARLRRGPRGRGLARALVVAHVAFWSVLGWTRTSTRDATAPDVPEVAANWPGEPQPFLAGVGDASFRLDADDAVAGYGAGARRAAFPWPVPGPALEASLAWTASAGADGTPRVPLLARGVPGAQALGARALVLRPAGGSGPPFGVCRLDLVLVDEGVTQEVLRRVADLGFVPATLLLCATHTHAGPGGFTRTPLAQVLGTDHFRADAFERVVSAAAAALRAAHDGAVPATVGVVRARDRDAEGRPILAQNRTGGDPDAVDTEVLGLRFDAAEGPRRIALLLNYAVHPVWSRPKDLEFSRDLAGALEDDAAIGDGATVLFVNGAEGDVRPRVRPDRTAAAGAPDPLAAFSAAVAPALRARATSRTLRVSAALVRRDLGSPRALFPVVGDRATLVAAARSRFGDGALDAVANALLVPANALLWSAGATDVRLVGSLRGGLGAVAHLGAYMDHTTFPVACVRLETADDLVAMVGCPGEPNTSVGRAWKDEARVRGARNALVVGLANDHLAYVASPDEYALGGYEAQNTLFGPETATRLDEAVRGALHAAGFRLPEDSAVRRGPR